MPEEGHAIDLIGLAAADDPTKLDLLGIMTHDIANGEEGWAVPRGQVHDYDTSAWSDEDPIFLSDTEGMLSNVPGTFAINVGRVKYAAASGIVYVDIR